MNMAEDALLGAHILCFALAFGVSLFAETEMLRKANTALRHEDINMLRRAHEAVTRALAVIWVTGIALAVTAAETGFSPNATFWLKAVVVAALTANALRIEKTSLADLGEWVGVAPAALPRVTLVRLATKSGLAAGCWIAALTLSVSQYLMGSGVIIAALSTLVIVGTGLAVARIAAIRIHARGQVFDGDVRLRPYPDASPQ